MKCEVSQLVEIFEYLLNPSHYDIQKAASAVHCATHQGAIIFRNIALKQSVLASANLPDERHNRDSPNSIRKPLLGSTGNYHV